MLNSALINFVYPEYNNPSQFGLIGGGPTTSIIPDSDELASGEYQLFDLAILYSSPYIQYRKIFIRNDSGSDLENCTIQGYNTNSNNMILIAAEVDQDGSTIKLDGIEKIKDSTTEPKLYTEYTFAEYSGLSKITVGNIANGKSVGIWLKFAFAAVGANNVLDEFLMTFYCKEVGTASTLTKELTILNNRIDGNVNITKVYNTGIYKLYGYRIVEKDISVFGLDNIDVTYAVYVDNIFKTEVVGSNFFHLNIDEPHKQNVKVYLIPYSGYVPEIAASTVNFKNRGKIEFFAKNPSIFDVEKHLVYYDGATGTIVETAVGIVDAKDGTGSGNIIEKVEIL